MLVVDDISVCFGDEKVLDHFSCHIKRGDFACLTGKSGCGKTSLLKAFLGLTPLSGGEIRVEGEILNEKTCNFVRRRTMYLPQELSFPCDTVGEFINHSLRLGRIKNVQYSTFLLREKMVYLGLDEDILNKRMTEISGGQRQRMILAVLALLDKDIWLLDEPTAALDGTSRGYMIDFLLEQQRQGKTLVAVSHDMHFASCCSTVIQLD